MTYVLQHLWIYKIYLLCSFFALFFEFFVFSALNLFLGVFLLDCLVQDRASVEILQTVVQLIKPAICVPRMMQLEYVCAGTQLPVSLEAR